MNYYFSKTIQNANSIEEAVERTKNALHEEGFGVIAEIDFKQTLKEKLDVEFNPYIVLEACNPAYALKALNADIHIGNILPCNVTVMKKNNTYEVSSINPMSAMKEIDNSEIQKIAAEITIKLKNTLAHI